LIPSIQKPFFFSVLHRRISIWGWARACNLSRYLSSPLVLENKWRPKSAREYNRKIDREEMFAEALRTKASFNQIGMDSPNRLR
jgi:hypothetical protein